MSGKQSLYFGGVPIEPDVKKLRARFPEASLTIGRIIPHQEIEAVLNTEGDVDRKSCRYKTVVNAWRKLVENEWSIVLGSERGVGLKVLSPAERVGLSGGHLRKSYKQAVRAHRRASDAPREELSQEDLRRADHIQTVSATIVSHTRLLSRQVKPTMKEIGEVDRKRT